MTMDKYTIYCSGLQKSAQSLNDGIETIQKRADKLSKAMNKVTRGDHKASDLSPAYTAQTALAESITRLGQICGAMNTAALQFAEASAELSGRANLTAYYMQHTDTLSYEGLMGAYSAAITATGGAAAGYEVVKNSLKANGHSTDSLGAVSNALQDVKEGNVDILGTGKKVYKTVTTLAKGALAIAGCAATWAAASPVAIVSTAYTANTLYSCYSDIKNLWWGDESKVGQVNWLKGKATNVAGDLTEMLGVDREVGELVGKCVYGAGEFLVNIENTRNIAFKLKHETLTTPLEDQVKDALTSNFPSSIKSRIIQSDTSFDTVVNAIKEVPTAISGLWDIASKSPLRAIVYDYKLLSYQIGNLSEVVGMTKLLKDVADVTSDITLNVIDFVRGI